MLFSKDLKEIERYVGQCRSRCQWNACPDSCPRYQILKKIKEEIYKKENIENDIYIDDTDGSGNSITDNIREVQTDIKKSQKILPF